VHYAINGGLHVNIVAVGRRRDSRRGWSEPDGRDALLARFGDVAAPLRDLLAAPDAWATWSLFDLAVRRLAGRHLALLGDAAHPVLPYLAQGGALAIEDAAVLAGCLRLAGDDVPGALRRYDKARRRRVARVQNEARRNGRVYHLGGPAALARNLVLRRFRPAGLTERYAWLYDWRAGDRGA
jgi:salicylate hydroxylase